MRAYLALVLLFVSASAWAEVPHRIESQYDILVKGIKMAEVREVFMREENQYHIEAVTKPVGLLALFKPETIVVTSEGDIGEFGLQPNKFTHRRAHDSQMNNSAEFDWAHHEITHRDAAGIRTVKLNDGTQDRLSMMYQFVVAPPRGKLEMKFEMSNGSQLESLHYQIKPEQTVTTSFGKMRSYSLTSLPLNIPKKSEMWIAVDHSFVPCKVTLTEDGGPAIVQALTKLTIVP